MFSQLLLALLGLTLANAQTQLPACSDQCFASAISASGCQLTDYLCQCTGARTQISNSVENCLLSSTCTSSQYTEIIADTSAICSSALAAASSSSISAALLPSATTSSASHATSSAASHATSDASSARSHTGSTSSGQTSSLMHATSSAPGISTNTASSTVSAAASSSSAAASTNGGSSLKAGAVLALSLVGLLAI